MNPSATLEEIRSWPVEQRLEIIFQLWDEIVASDWRPELTDELREELDRRWAGYQANTTDVRTWEQIEARLKRNP